VAEILDVAVIVGLAVGVGVRVTVYVLVTVSTQVTPLEGVGDGVIVAHGVGVGVSRPSVAVATKFIAGEVFPSGPFPTSDANATA
jgi:hypothetical protein